MLILRLSTIRQKPLRSSVIADTRYSDLAFIVLLEPKCPKFLYLVVGGCGCCYEFVVLDGYHTYVFHRVFNAPVFKHSLNRQNVAVCALSQQPRGALDAFKKSKKRGNEKKLSRQRPNLFELNFLRRLPQPVYVAHRHRNESSCLTRFHPARRRVMRIHLTRVGSLS
jgi:hypothetical protein